jgi:deoxyribonucleoside regulator
VKSPTTAASAPARTLTGARPLDSTSPVLDTARRALLVEIAELYYLDERSQQDIAGQLGVSRSTVSRLLAEARDAGVVQIRINRESARDEALEDRLGAALGIRAWVLRGHEDGSDALTTVGAACARLLERTLRPGGVLSLTHGSTVYAVMRALRIEQLPGLRMVQMAGFEVGNPLNDGWELIRLCFDRIDSRYRYVHAPLLVSSDELHAALMEDTHQRETFGLVRSSDVALLGIGTVDPVSSSLARGGILTSEALDEARRRGSVGAINGFHFRLDGSLVEGVDHRIVGVLPSELGEGTRRIAVAVGTLKAAPVLGASRAGWLDELVTDVSCAEGILSLLETRTGGSRVAATGRSSST